MVTGIAVANRHLPMTETKLLPIALLYTEGRQSVDGATRFQKLVFLAQEEYDVDESFEYEEDKFGPYSYELDRALDEFIDRGWIDMEPRTNAAGNEKYVYSLTPKGDLVARKMLEKDPLEGVFEELTKVKRRFNDWPLQRLLKYTYDRYPDYTGETDLDVDRLFDPDARTQFLEPDTDTDTTEFLGAGPEKALEVNTSAEDLFPSD